MKMFVCKEVLISLNIKSDSLFFSIPLLSELPRAQSMSALLAVIRGNNPEKKRGRADEQQTTKLLSVLQPEKGFSVNEGESS